MVLLYLSTTPVRTPAEGREDTLVCLLRWMPLSRLSALQAGVSGCRAKVKDGEDGVVTPFRLEHVVLGTDEDGDEISSCVAVR